MVLNHLITITFPKIHSFFNTITLMWSCRCLYTTALYFYSTICSVLAEKYSTRQVLEECLENTYNKPLSKTKGRMWVLGGEGGGGHFDVTIKTQSRPVER